MIALGIAGAFVAASALAHPRPTPRPQPRPTPVGGDTAGAVSVVERAQARGGLGESVRAGRFALRNVSGGNLSAAAIDIDASDPTLFGGLTLEGSDGSRATSGAAPDGSLRLRFAAPVAIAPGESVTFDLVAEMFRADAGQGAMIVRAALVPLDDRGMGAIGLLMLGFFLSLARRRRPGVGACLLFLVAMAGAGCGEDPNLSSEQTVTGVIGTGGQAVAVSGLPAVLGSVSVR